MRTPKPVLPALVYVYVMMDNTANTFLIFEDEDNAKQVADENRTMFPDHEIIVKRRVVHK